MTDESEHDPKTETELIRLLKSNESPKTLNEDIGSAVWTSEEIICLLKLVAEYEYLPQIISNNDQVYTKLSKLMTISGHKKSNEEIKSIWNGLKDKWNDFKEGLTENFQYSKQLELLFNATSQTDPAIIIIKDEEFENTILNSTSILNENESTSEEYPQKKRGSRRLNWTYKETECVVQVLEKYGMPNRNNLRKICHVTVDYLKQHGYFRTEEQAQVKIKHLRALHNQVVRKSLKEEEFSFFKRIENLMQQQSRNENDGDESQNYITLDEHSKSDMEDTGIPVDVLEVNEEDEDSFYKKGRQIWTDGEIRCLLKFIEQNGIVAGKQLRKLSNKVVDYLAEHGFYRTSAQILIRWKNTKALYWAAFRKKTKQPERDCPFFYRLHAILNPDDFTYEPKQEDHFEENNIFQERSGENNCENNTNISHFNFNDVVTNTPSMFKLKGENFVTVHHNNSNSSDNFSSANNNSNSKQELIDLMENEQSQEESHNPKRKRLDPIEISLSSTNSSLDSVDHYCISLAHNIKKLNARQQAKLKIEIQQLMYKAEFDPSF